MTNQTGTRSDIGYLTIVVPKIGQINFSIERNSINSSKTGGSIWEILYCVGEWVNIFF